MSEREDSGSWMMTDGPEASQPKTPLTRWRLGEGWAHGREGGKGGSLGLGGAYVVSAWLNLRPSRSLRDPSFLLERLFLPSRLLHLRLTWELCTGDTAYW